MVVSFFIIIDRDELHQLQTLCDLSELKIILVSLPESIAANIRRMVTDSMRFETAIIIGNFLLQLFDIESRFFVIDAR
jgi:hypothetical protein